MIIYYKNTNFTNNLFNQIFNWPRANAEMKSFMKNLGKVIRFANITWMKKIQALKDFLIVFNDSTFNYQGSTSNSSDKI